MQIDQESDDANYDEAFKHKPRLREVVWKPRSEREKRCARCTLVKPYITTIVMAGEQFGLCDRCLETLWNLAFHDE